MTTADTQGLVLEARRTAPLQPLGVTGLEGTTWVSPETAQQPQPLPVQHGFRERTYRQQAAEMALLASFNRKEVIGAVHRLVLGHEQPTHMPLNRYSASAENTVSNHGAVLNDLGESKPA